MREGLEERERAEAVGQLATLERGAHLGQGARAHDDALGRVQLQATRRSAVEGQEGVGEVIADPVDGEEARKRDQLADVVARFFR